MIKVPVITALNNSTYVAISTDSTNDAYGFAVYTDDASAFYIAVDVGGTGAALVPENASLSWAHHVEASENVLWAKSVTGTPNLVLLPGKHE